MAAKKRTLEDFFSPEDSEETPIPYRSADDKRQAVLAEEKRRNESRGDKGPIDINGFLSKPKKGVTEKQEIKADTTIAPAPRAEAPIVPPAPTPMSVPAPQMASKPQVAAPVLPPGPSAWERALIGATPLLVGLLTGNEQEGMEVAGNQITGTESKLYNNRMDLDKRLAEMQMKASMAGTKGGAQGKTFEYINPQTGKAHIGRMVNNQYYTDVSDPLAIPKAGAKENYVKIERPNPETGAPEIIFVNPASQTEFSAGQAWKDPKRQIVDIENPNGEASKAVANVGEGRIESFLGKIPVKPSAGEAGKSDRQIRSIRVGLLKDITKPTSVYSQKRDSAEGMARAAQLLNSNVPVAESGVGLILARSVFGEKGPLSDGDVTRLKGDPSAQAAASRIFDKYVNGEALLETDKADLRTVINAAYGLAKKDANDFLDSYVKTYAAEGDGEFDLSKQLEQFRRFPDLPAHRGSMQTSRQRRDGIAPTPTALSAGHKEAGYVFKGGDPKDKKNWVKE